MEGRGPSASASWTAPTACSGFEIASCARSAGPAVHAAYDKLRVARGGQQLMWTRFCQKVAEESGGAVEEGVEVHTFRARYEDPLTPGDSEEPSPYESVLADLSRPGAEFRAPGGGDRRGGVESTPTNRSI